MYEAYLGAIFLWAPNFAPRGYMFCNGQILSISQNTALFSLLGTMYPGGNGSSTFALPNLNGRIPIGTGQSAGLTPHTLGEVGGFENTTLTPQNLPQHTHYIRASDQRAFADSPVNQCLAKSDDDIYGSVPAARMDATVIEPAGEAQPAPFTNLPPYLALNYIICVEGLYPTRD